jgi:hypothetical protein
MCSKQPHITEAFRRRRIDRNLANDVSALGGLELRAGCGCTLIDTQNFHCGEKSGRGGDVDR